MDIYVMGNVYNRGPTDGDYQILVGHSVHVLPMNVRYIADMLGMLAQCWI